MWGGGNSLSTPTALFLLACEPLSPTGDVDPAPAAPPALSSSGACPFPPGAIAVGMSAEALGTAVSCTPTKNQGPAKLCAGTLTWCRFSLMGKLRPREVPGFP